MDEGSGEDDLDGEPQNRGKQTLLILGFWNTSLSGGHFLTQHEPLYPISLHVSYLKFRVQLKSFLIPKPPFSDDNMDAQSRNKTLSCKHLKSFESNPHEETGVHG